MIGLFNNIRAKLSAIIINILTGGLTFESGDFVTMEDGDTLETEG